MRRTSGSKWRLTWGLVAHTPQAAPDLEEEQATEVEQHKPEEEQQKDNGADWSWRSKKNQRTKKWVKKMRKKLRRKRQKSKEKRKKNKVRSSLRREDSTARQKKMSGREVSRSRHRRSCGSQVQLPQSCCDRRRRRTPRVHPR